MGGPDGVNVGTSRDGLTFAPASPLSFNGRTLMVWSAAVLPEGRVRVFGTFAGPGTPGAPNGIVSATSSDGATWSLDPGIRLQGASDHGVLRRADGTWLMAYVDRIP